MILLSKLAFLFSLIVSAAVPSTPVVPKTNACLANPNSSALHPYLEYLRHPTTSASAEVKEEVSSMLKAYAPRVWWHPDEAYGAMDPLEFISKSSLWFRSSLTRQEKVAAKGEIDAEELGRAHRGRYAKADYAPSFTSRIMRRTSLGEGAYYLKYEDSKYRGSENPPLLWKFSERQDEASCLESGGKRTVLIEYWYHSAYNGADVYGLGDHQGDWEGVAMLITIDARPKKDGGVKLRHELKSVFLAAHEGGSWHCPQEVGWTGMEGSRPEVYSALGTHATYAKAGDHDQFFITDKTARGRAWDGWENLRPLESEPYYGYSGAWGEEGMLSFMTGPLVPGPGFKAQPKSEAFARSKTCVPPTRRMADVDF